MEISIMIVTLGAFAGLILGAIVKIARDKNTPSDVWKMSWKYFVMLIIIFLTFMAYFRFSDEKLMESPVYYNDNITEISKQIEGEDKNNKNQVPLDAAVPVSNKLNKEDIVLGDIELLTSIIDMRKNSNMDLKKEEGLYGTIYFSGNDLQIMISRASNKVSSVYLLSDKYKTARGIAVGGDESQIMKVYGKYNFKLDTIPDIPGGYGYEYYYQDESIAAILRFVVDDKSKKIIYIGVRAFNGKLDV
ncbi:hypothetical protein [Azotosporobacter soli]|uniref:hypothetical protein n=1 Tax=Azotosporobacter soli TaxID=3055040 RepID=UPI0031FE4D49